MCTLTKGRGELSYFSCSYCYLNSRNLQYLKGQALLMTRTNERRDLETCFTSLLRLFRCFVHNCFYTIKYIGNLVTSKVSAFVKKLRPSKLLGSKILTRSNVENYLKHWRTFKPHLKSRFARKVRKWDFGTRAKLINSNSYFFKAQKTFIRIGEKISDNIRIAKRLHPNHYSKDSWIGRHGYPILKKHWKLLTPDNPIYLFFLVASLIMLKELDLGCYHEVINYVRVVEFRANWRNFEKWLNGAFSHNPIASEVINQAKSFNRIMCTPQFDDYSCNIIHKVLDTSSKFSDFNYTIVKEQIASPKSYNPKIIKVTLNDIPEGCCIVSIFFAVLYFTACSNV